MKSAPPSKVLELLEEVIDDGHDKEQCWAVNSPLYYAERRKLPVQRDPNREDAECDCHVHLVKEALALLQTDK